MSGDKMIWWIGGEALPFDRRQYALETHLLVFSVFLSIKIMENKEL